MKCRECGEEGAGRYCAQCGAPLGAGDGERCSECGADLPADAYFCPECGEPVRERPEKEPGDYMPWVLSGLALVAFAVGITLLVQEQSAPRESGAPLTGGVIESGTPGDADRPGGVAPGDGAPGGAGAMPGGEGADGGSGAGPGGGMPSADELAEMAPREAADRLFNRTMRLRAAGDPEGRASFFARMAVQAYRRVPSSEVDADVRFHVGLLELVRERPEAAGAAADTILVDEPGHLLGLLLAARAAEARGDGTAAGRWRDSLQSAADRTSLDARPEYRAHDSLLEEALGETTAGEGGG